ncbi:pitrilysin family protein [Roseofilum sp. BLCC_M154]|uniref:Pitrilysin family protein n=1 Tax=Roseofilum acuticapitatum BLCC-M154 TaxID=3022444 RepID=A0ABT7ALY8_9CYAN|nr:pitrilysin family protein [Roseofilum acuticapitatum]MDJ1167906.1 pitrilysin family protein [Roseofilum acuticapitatum BLCC-M154]
MTSTLLRSATPARCIAPTVRHLQNGLTIVAEQMPVDAVNLSLWLPVGSAVESDPINGMAHFLEHMIFKGTPNLSPGEFERQIEERGAITNALTSQDYTQFYITTAPQDFIDLAPLQFEVVLNASIPDEAFERERSVVIEEIHRAQDNPRRRVYQKAMELAFETLPYRRPVLGPKETIETLKPEQMRDFHQHYYHPQNLTAAVVGNLPVDELIQIVADSCTLTVTGERLKNTKTVLPTLGQLSDAAPFNGLSEAPFTTIERRESVDPSLQQARLVMVWRVPGALAQEKTYAFDVLSSILSQGRTSRLVRQLREERNLVSSVVAANLTYHNQGLFYVAAQLPTEHLKEVEEAIAEQIASLSYNLQDSELQRIRTQVANRFIFGTETPSDRANLYGYHQAMLQDVNLALNYPTCIRSLEVEDLQGAARSYLSPEAYGIVTIKPE